MQPKQLILDFNYPDLFPYAPCYKNCSDYEILNQAGTRFIEVAQDIKDDFESWWIDWSNPSESGDCLLPADWENTFLSSYLQQSIDVSFLDKYLIDTPRLSHERGGKNSGGLQQLDTGAASINERVSRPPEF